MSLKGWEERVRGLTGSPPAWWVDHLGMVIDMNEAQVRTLEQVREVLAGTHLLEMRPVADEAGRYPWIETVLRRFDYRCLGRAERGVVLEYLQRMSGYSRAQVTRLVSRWVARKRLVKRYRAPEHAFARRYSGADVDLLAQVDQAMGTLSGPATACVLRRQRDVYGEARFARLGSISVAHLYNLRNSAPYRDKRILKTRTRPVKAVTIGVRKAPAPQGRPGFIRIDSVHQGDQDGIKGLYHINAVDCVTQWEVVATVQGLSEAFLLPVIQHMLSQFPFELLGFHSDNGSEYVNDKVASMLEKLRIEFTRSRPRRSNDNGLAETKNGAVVRKVFGYAHIPQQYAAPFNAFCCEHLNPFLNFHRPCLFATDRPDPKRPGRIKHIYRPTDAMTPLDKLASLPTAQKCLREGVALRELQIQASAITDLQAATNLNAARQVLFKRLKVRVA